MSYMTAVYFYLLFLNTMLKVKHIMQKIIPPIPNPYISTRETTGKVFITMIVDPSGGIPSVSY